MNLILASTASLLHCCSAQCFSAPKGALRTRSTAEKCLAMSIFFKSLVSQINPLHWLDYTAVLCTNYYCSNSSRTKIWLDGAHHRKSDKKARALPLDIIAGAISSFYPKS